MPLLTMSASAAAAAAAAPFPATVVCVLSSLADERTVDITRGDVDEVLLRRPHALLDANPSLAFMLHRRRRGPNGRSLCWLLSGSSNSAGLLLTSGRSCCSPGAALCVGTCYIVADSLLNQLHLLLRLHDLSLPSRTPLCVLMLPIVAVQACVQALQRGEPPVAALNLPLTHALVVDGKHSHVQVLFCTRWSQVASVASTIRVLFIRSLELTQPGLERQLELRVFLLFNPAGTPQ